MEIRLKSLTYHKFESSCTDYKPNGFRTPLEYSSGYMHAASEP